MLPTLSGSEIAWAAGFFDGEGSTSLAAGKGKGGPFMSLRVPQAGDYAPRILTRFKNALGGIGKVYGPYPQTNRKDAYQWAATTFEHAQAALAMLWNFLSEQKREQAKRAMTLMAAKHQDPEYRYYKLP